MCVLVLAFCDAGSVLAENNQNNVELPEQEIPDEGITEEPEEPEQSEHTHVYVETITKQPTESNKGEKTYTCECGDTYTEEIPALNLPGVRISKLQNVKNGVEIVWEEVEGAATYKLYRGTSETNSSTYVELATLDASVLSYVDTEVISGRSYYYNVMGYNGDTVSIEQSPVKIVYLGAPAIVGEKTASGIKLSWDAVNGADYYVIEKSVSGSDWEVVETTDKTTYSESSFALDNVYAYRVYTYWENEEYSSRSGYSDVFSVTWDMITAPEGFKVVNNGYTQLKLTWNKVAGAEGYQIYRSKTNKKGSFVKVATVEDTKYIDKKLKTDTKYYYKIRSYVGEQISEFTVVKYATPKVIKPTIKQIATATKNSITVSWNKSTGAHGYYVYRKQGDGTWKKIATIKDPATTSYKDKNAKGRYFYSLRAYKKVNGNTYTSFRTDAIEVSVLGKAILSSVEQKGTDCAVTVKWEKVSNATGYQVYKKIGKNGSWKLAKTTGKDARSYTCDIPQGTYTYWKVRAIRDIGDSRTNGSFSDSETYIFANPKFNYMASDRWSGSVDEVTLTIQNTSSATMRFYSENAMIIDPWDDELYWYLDLVNSNGEKINYCDVKAGQTRTLTFKVQGGNAEYYSSNELCVVFRFDGLKYLFITDAASTDPELYLITEE